MKTADLIRALALFACVIAAPAQTTVPASTDVTLLEGRGELLQFNNDIQKVAVAEPKIADAVVISPREVMINGKSNGKTTIVIWEATRTPQRYNVTVAADTADWDTFKKALQDSVSDPITVEGKGETIV